MRPAPEDRPRAWRRRLLLGAWLLAGLGICARAAQIQVVQGAEWRSLAQSQHTTARDVSAARGAVLDRDGAPLVVSRETYQVSVAPGELVDRDRGAALLRETLELSEAKARALTDPADPWRVVPGRFPPSVREELSAVRGIYLDRRLERLHPHGDLARGVLGVVIDDEGRGGIEQRYDSLLRGTPGRAVVARDNVGRPIPGETIVVDPPRAGGEVVLTLDMDLQEIARQALREAIAESGARGGDVLVTDPSTGEILALVSLRDGRPGSLSAINSPYEPGSTLKPFTVAGLLERGRAALSDTVDVEGGVWRVAGRTLHDVSAHGRITLADALRVSSNVGVAKAARALSPGEQYENLRDFGFGVPTGIELPGEVGGVLRRPDGWTAQSRASLAIGYEVSVTPLQMAMAYGAIANGGLLLEPRLVKEVRDARGRTVERFGTRTVRRVLRPRVARRIAGVLEEVVEDGSGTRARLATFRVAGKSGTSRAYDPAGGYRPGDYYASFAGFFPAEDPQLVIFVKLERPRNGAYYGGSVAAPVTRATMEAALAARSTPLDRFRLLRTTRDRRAAPEAPVVRFASSTVDPPPAPLDEEQVEGVRPSSMALPDMTGLPVRVAARRLHALGLRVTLEGRGDITATLPAPGTRVAPGDTVRLRSHGGGGG